MKKLVVLIGLGMVLLSVSNLYARYFEPQTGRYITPDPIGLEGGINPYGYAGQDPINNTDPEGLAYSPYGEHGIQPDGTIDPTRMRQMECEDKCIAKVLGIETAAAAAITLASEPSIAKPFTQGGAVGTSPLSRGLSKIPGLSKPLPISIPTPIRGNLGAASNIPGRILGRGLGWIGAGLLAYDYAQIVNCVLKCQECGGE